MCVTEEELLRQNNNGSTTSGCILYDSSMVC